MRSERMLHRFRTLVLLSAFLCTVLGIRGNGIAEERKTNAPTEYEVKAAFVHNFVKFVEWPDVGQPADSIRLCILGDPPNVEAFTALSGREVRGKKMIVLPIIRPGEVIDCEVLFVTANQTGRLSEIVETLDDLPVLTIGDTEGYARRGIMINLFLENKRVRFEINEQKARAAGLRVSAKLLKLASRIYGATTNGKE